MTIQRYTGENVEFHAAGDLVAYEDYAELKEEYERLDKSHSAAQAKIDSLAAENAALKSMRVEGEAFENIIRMPDFTTDAMDDAAWQAYLKHCNEDDHMPFGEMYRAAVMAFRGEGFDVETPATDSALASMRAEGVEMALTGLLSYLNHDVDIDSMETKWDVSSAVVEYINSQLRSKSEVQS